MDDFEIISNWPYILTLNSADIHINSKKSFVPITKTDILVCSIWLTTFRGRPVRALRLVSKDSEFNPSVGPSVVKFANHC